MTVVKARKWGKADKDKLAGLIDTGTIDIDQPQHLTPAYIDRIRDQSFCHFGIKNFRGNYRNFLRQHSLAGEYDGARRGGKCVVYYYYYYYLLLFILPLCCIVS